ncbi:U32 family peptidase [Brucepastera parasyntrophica]|uniref:peptidase U32 family protein n=1 Tax=Brucepastera parasyntrophica TaxID=2880008 RepID=UPI00210DC42F|nr:peptidase U32 family protein [Brucepastera parasyntrophica]ULQ59286.1 U32 family peptidase [Brucepastera parasyntrophica]
MELVSPAGNAEKLQYAWEYGADAAYIGLKNFSLRVKADNFHGREHEYITRIKADYAAAGKPKKLFCALNITFHNDDIAKFLSEADYFRNYPFDAFIIQDMGMVRILQKEFPSVPLHLSTQANCVNSKAAKMYLDMGFKRIVLGREAGLAEIAEIKQAVPEMELECFVHGAMCIAYSGRCLMSAYLTGRSANKGFCSHTCRWDWQLLSGEKETVVEERERPGEFFPVVEEDGYTSLFSSKDLCMIDHLTEMKKAGVDALKIEGRMKSLYYTAVVTRAYRKKLDALEGLIPETEAAPYADDLENVAHREFSSGFYFDKNNANKTTRGKSSSPYLLAGIIGKEFPGKGYEFIAMNKIDRGMRLEYIGPDLCAEADTAYILIDPDTGAELDWVSHGHPCIIRTEKPVRERFIVRCLKE